MLRVFVVVLFLGAVSPPGRADELPSDISRSIGESTQRLRTSADDHARRQSAVAIAAYGAEAKSAVPALVRALSDKSLWVRIEAARALGRIGPEAKAAVPVLIHALADDSRPSDDEQQFDRDPAHSLRETALTALSMIGYDADAALPHAIAGLRDPSTSYRKAAVEAVLRLAPDGQVRLVAEIEDGNEVGLWEIFWALDDLEGAPVEFLSRLLASRLGRFDDRDIFGVSSWDGILKYLHRRRTTALPALRSKIADPDLAIRTYAAAALADLSPDDDRIVPILVEGLKSAKLRQRSAESLGRIGAKARPAIEPLVRGMENQADDADDFRLQCAAALARISPAHVAMLTFLENWRRDVALKESPSKWMIVDDLARLGRIAVNDLLKLLNHADDDMRLAAVETLGRIGPDARPALPTLIAILETEEQEEMHADICKAIREIGLDERNVDSAPTFLKLLIADRPYLFADELVGQLGAGVIADLIAIVDDRKAKLWARVCAARALEFIGDDAETAAPAVAAFLKSHSKDLDGYSKCLLVGALKRIGKNCPEAALAVAAEFPILPDCAGPALVVIGSPAVIPLSKWLSDDRDEIRLSAVETLAQFDDNLVTVRAGLVKAMQDADCHVREVATVALGKQQHRSPEALAALLAALTDVRMPIRAAAAASLTGYESEAGRVLPLLVGALQDDFLAVRVSACRALGTYGPSALEAVAALEQIATRDEFAPARITAREALRKILPGEN
ncbi:MAG: HEAT repeat domain-containing protein [Planctomycetes bacterium]|nr:HEAT repeat domain-containing protein [Planctomycetota bacterium]